MGRKIIGIPSNQEGHLVTRKLGQVKVDREDDPTLSLLYEYENFGGKSLFKQVY